MMLIFFGEGRRWALVCLAFFSCFSHFFSSFLLPTVGKCWTCLCFAILQELLPNRILLITIHNPLYPITVDVLHQVFSPHGFVEKIVTFQKSAGQLLFCLYYDSSLCPLWTSFLSFLASSSSLFVWVSAAGQCV